MNTSRFPFDEVTPEQEADERRQRGENHAQQGDLRGDDGDFVGALGEYKKAAEISPDSSARLTKLADSYVALDLPHKAVDYYQRALQTEEAKNGADLTEAHVGLGDLCRSLALSAAAVRSYTRAVRSRPKNAFFRWKLGLALAATGHFEESEQQFQAALEIAPRDTFYRFQLAELYLMMRREDEAIEEMREVASLAPRDDYYQLRVGALLLRNQRVEEALKYFEAAARLKPASESHHTLLRYAHSRCGQEAPIAVDVDMIALGAYDEDFVRRFQALSQPAS